MSGDRRPSRKGTDSPGEESTSMAEERTLKSLEGIRKNADAASKDIQELAKYLDGAIALARPFLDFLKTEISGSPRKGLLLDQKTGTSPSEILFLWLSDDGKLYETKRFEPVSTPKGILHRRNASGHPEPVPIIIDPNSAPKSVKCEYVVGNFDPLECGTAIDRFVLSVRQDVNSKRSRVEAK